MYVSEASVNKSMCFGDFSHVNTVQFPLLKLITLRNLPFSNSTINYKTEC